jgi:hypothetical protein
MQRVLLLDSLMPWMRASSAARLSISGQVPSDDSSSTKKMDGLAINELCASRSSNERRRLAVSGSTGSSL